MGYDNKNLIDGNNEKWVNELIVFIDLKVSKLFYNIETRYPMSFGYIIMKHQKSNKEGLDLFYIYFYEFCQLYIDNFTENLDKYIQRSLRKFNETDFN